MLDIDKELSDAVRHFWHVRNRQQDNQGSKTGQKDAGSRAAVTGGKHGDGFISLIAGLMREAGISDSEIFITQKTLPCYFRPSKDWDLIVKVGDDLIAVIEIKAHVGSFGNNFNNRVEEALGSATDFWSAYRESTFKPSARPWLGYLMLLEQAPASVRTSKRRKLPHYQLREEFQEISYAQRYEIFCERLVHERLYDATCFLMSSAKEGIEGKYVEPNVELSFRNFAASLSGPTTAYAHGIARVRHIAGATRIADTRAASTAQRSWLTPRGDPSLRNTPEFRYLFPLTQIAKEPGHQGSRAGYGLFQILTLGLVLSFVCFRSMALSRGRRSLSRRRFVSKRGSGRAAQSSESLRCMTFPS